MFTEEALKDFISSLSELSAVDAASSRRRLKAALVLLEPTKSSSSLLCQVGPRNYRNYSDDEVLENKIIANLRRGGKTSAVIRNSMRPVEGDLTEKAINRLIESGRITEMPEPKNQRNTLKLYIK